MDRMLELALSGPTEEERLIQIYDNYYRGNQGVRLSERQKEYVLTQIGLPSSLANISKLVVSVLNDRLKIRPNGRGIRPLGGPESSEYAKTAADWWVLSGLDAVQSEIHRNTLRDKISGVMVEWDQVNNRPVVTPARIWYETDYESSVRIFTDGNDNIIFASKMWVYADYTDDSVTYIRINIYEPGLTFINDAEQEELSGALISRFIVELGGNYQSAVPLTDEQVSLETGGAVQENPQELPIPELPIIRFENFPDTSELDDVVTFQDFINHSVATADISIDYHGFPMLSGSDFSQVDEQAVGPGTFIIGEDVKRIEPPDLKSIWQGTVLEFLRLLAIVKRWPVWVLLTDTSGNAPSGEALRRQERPLISQIEEKQHRFQAYWQQVFHHARKLHNYYNPTNMLDGELDFLWIDPSTVNQAEQRRTQVQTAKEAGVSLFTILEQIFGFSEVEIEQEYDRLKKEQMMVLQAFPDDGRNPDGEAIRGERNSLNGRNGVNRTAQTEQQSDNTSVDTGGNV